MKNRQYVPLNMDSDGNEVQIRIGSAETKYSNPIYHPGEEAYAWLGLYVASSHNITLTISIEYKFPGTPSYQTAIEIDALSVGLGVTVKYYRLDALLGANWIPNVESRFKFVASTQAGLIAYIRGVHSV